MTARVQVIVWFVPVAIAAAACGNQVLAPGPSCTDGTKGANETDVDCGGVCRACGVGQICSTDDDCRSGNCMAGACAPAPTCNDTTRNGTETDVDCGGGCRPCAVGQRCGGAADCTSGRCVNNSCEATAPGCSNGTHDGSETDVDCGGGACALCADGKQCRGGGDCSSGSCAASRCVAAGSCSDSMRNGTETDIDCGGSCPACALGRACLRAADCQGGLCVNNLCSTTMSQSPLLQFAPVVHYGASAAPTSVDVGDFDGDGKPDLAAGNQMSRDVSVLLGNGDGTFGAPHNTALSDSIGAVVVADFNGDRRADVALSVWNSQQSYNAPTILLGKGDGTLQSPISYAVHGAWPQAGGLVVADYNGDGRSDLAVPSVLGNCCGNTPTFVTLLLATANGTFQTSTPFAAGMNGHGAAAGDFDADGRQDVALLDQANNGNGTVTNTLYTFLGNGDGTLPGPKLSSVGTVVNGAYGVFGVGPLASGDFDGDGKIDLAMGWNGVLVMLGKGDGTFPSSRTYPGGVPWALATGDLDGDGHLDIASAGPVGGAVTVLLGKGDGTFPVALDYYVGKSPQSVAIRDFDGNGKADVVVANSDTLGVLLNSTQ